MHKGVSVFSPLVVITDNTELRMQKCCNYIVLIIGKHTLNPSLERTVAVYLGVKNLLAPLQRKRDSLIFNT